MESVIVERVDHLGVIAEVIKDLGLIELINARLVPDDQEAMTPGEAIAGMMLNSLGFSNRPLSLTPQFFANKPLDLLCREGIRADMFNRCTLGRTLDEVHAYGGDGLLSERSLAVCGHEGIDVRFNHLDTASFARTGDDIPESDAQAIAITHGYATDHRPDLKHAVLALMVSQDGGVPLVRKSWDGKASASQIVQERAQALMATLKRSATPRDLVADSTLSQEDNATNLQALGFITRIPGTLKLVSQVIAHALGWDTWQRGDDPTRSQRLELCHYGMAQRWLVVSADAAFERAEARVSTAQQRASAVIATQLLHVQAQRFETPEAAQEALEALAKAWTYPQVDASGLIDHTRYACQGRPTPTTPVQAIAWHIQGQVRPEEAALAQRTHDNACCVLGTTIAEEQWSAPAVIAAYKGQARAEGGFRFLKDPLFFVSSLCVKKPSRIQGLLMVRTLALLVYSVAQRRLRQE
jgi:transposase